MRHQRWRFGQQDFQIVMSRNRNPVKGLINVSLFSSPKAFSTNVFSRAQGAQRRKKRAKVLLFFDMCKFFCRKMLTKTFFCIFRIQIWQKSDDLKEVFRYPSLLAVTFFFFRATILPDCYSTSCPVRVCVLSPRRIST